jgi:hypothetical protein
LLVAAAVLALRLNYSNKRKMFAQLGTLPLLAAGKT